MSNHRDIVESADAIFCGIGKLIVAFQQVEMWLAESLAGMLLLKDKTDKHLVASAMSYRQKVDLMVELHKKRKPKYGGKASLNTIRKALYVAEEFRNRIVHSFWEIECGETDRWVRIKASLRGKNGLNVISRNGESINFEECHKALQTIREWMLTSEERLVTAIQILKKAEEEIENGDS